MLNNVSIFKFSAFQSAKVANMASDARRSVSRVQIMQFVISRQESARGLVYVLLVLLVKTVKIVSIINDHELRGRKTCLRGIRPSPTQIGLYSYRRWIKA